MDFKSGGTHETTVCPPTVADGTMGLYNQFMLHGDDKSVVCLYRTKGDLCSYLEPETIQADTFAIACLKDTERTHHLAFDF
jgi:hypothetical protein